MTLHSFDGSSAVAGYNNAKVINEDIKWESIQTLDVGLDMEFFKNRLAVSFDWYQRITKDMIYALSVPNSSGITRPSSLGTMATMPVNLGRIDNTGWELLVSYRNNVGGFSYAVSANVSQNRNRVVDLNGDGTIAEIPTEAGVEAGITDWETIAGGGVDAEM